MRAAWLVETGGPGDVVVADRPEPVARPTSVVVDVHAASVNYPDVLMLGGRYQIQPELPFTPGSEFAGTVRSVGTAVTGFRPGDRVCGGVLTGAFADQVRVPASALSLVPEELDWVQAAAYRVVAVTAYHSLVTFGEVGAGATVVVLGAAGGVGSACVSIAALLGARVVAVVSSPEKAEFVRSLGADEVVDHRRETVRTRLKELVPTGADAVIDPVGGSLSEDSLRCLRWGGRFVVVGFASGEIPRIPLNLVLLKGVGVRGFEVRTLPAQNPTAAAAGDRALARLVRDGLRPAVDSVFPLERVGEALSRVADGRALGKVVITPR